MSNYTLTAKQAYDADSASREQAAYDAGDHSLNDPGGFVMKESFSFLYDRAHNAFVYGLQLQAYVHASTPNDTGRTLTDGFTETVAPAATYDSAKYGNFNTAVKDVASGAVTLYPAYSAGQNVPNGVSGSDGTYGFLTDIINQDITGVGLVDPRTSNFVCHAFGDDNPCSIYIFETSLNYAQRIFPWTAVGGSVDNHMEPAGITDSYIYALNAPYVVLTDRTLEAGELAAGYIYTYAKYTLPFEFDVTQYRWMFSADNHMFIAYTSRVESSPRELFLCRVTEPTSAPYGGPQVGGSVDDWTPWASTTGPNSNLTDWETNWAPPSDLKLYDLRDGNMALVVEWTPKQHDLTSHDPAFYRVDCTYVPLAGGAFDYHEGFVTGYMKGTSADTFTTATGVSDADWVVEQLLEVDQDVNMHAYAFPGVNYAQRTFFAVVQPVVAGSWTYDIANRLILVLTYDFASGAAPVCSTFISGQNWDDVYSGSTGVSHPAYDVIDTWGNNTNPWYESGVKVPDGSWWWMGADDFMATLDPSFTYESWNNYSLPFVRYAIGVTPPPAATYRANVWSTIGFPTL